MVKKEELVARLKQAKSWREVGYTISEVLDAIENSGAGSAPNTSEKDERISELEEKVSRLMESNKRLRQENKQLKEQ